MKQLATEALSLYRDQGFMLMIKRGSKYIKTKLGTVQDDTRNNIAKLRGYQQFTLREHTAKFSINNTESAKATRWRISTEKEQLLDLLGELRRDDVVFDIGANTGIYSIFASNICDQVIAFEPYPPNIAELRKNIDINNKEIKIVEKALSNNSRIETISVPETDTPGHGHATFSDDDGSNHLEIKAEEGDQLVESGKVPQPNIVKIDVEGSEPLVLEGLENALMNDNCRILYCEVHLPTDHRSSIHDFGYTVPELWELIESYGFKIETIWGRGSPDFFIKAKKENNRIPDGGYTFFGSPRAIHNDGKTFVGSISSTSDIQVSSIDEEDQVETVVLETDFNSNKFKTDDHASPQVFARDDGHILAFWDRKIGEIRYKISERPNDLTSFGERHTIKTGGADYASPVQLPDGRILLFYRGPSRSEHSFYESNDGGKTWMDRGCFIKTDPSRAVYTDNFHSENDIHFVVSNHPRNDGTERAFDEPHNIWYIKYDVKNELWKAADGSCIMKTSELPLDLVSDLDEVYNSITNKAEAWLWDIQVHNNMPRILFATFAEPTNHRYHYAKWTGSSWEVNEITDAGGSLIKSGDRTEEEYSGGICFDEYDPYTVYASVEGEKNQYTIKRFISSNGGETWHEQEDIATGFRPVSVSNADIGDCPSIIYMNGYYRFFEDFDTDIFWSK